MNDFEFYEIVIKLSQIVNPILIVFGIIGNLLNIIILNERHIRISPCSIYFLSLSINNLFYSSILMIYNYLLDVYKFDPAAYSNIFCKLISYLLNVTPQLSVFYIVLASIDRYFSSSSNVGIRRLSNKKMSIYLLSIVTLYTFLMMIGILITFDLRNDGLGCTSRSDSLFNQIFLIIEVTQYVILCPLLLLIFGFLTIENTRKLMFMRRRLSVHRRTEKQLSKMLIVQVLTHLILVLPFCTMFLMLIIPIEFRLTFRFYIIYTLTKIPFYLTFISPFFLYILSAKIYRDEFQRILFKLNPFHRILNQGNSIRPVNNTSLQTQQNHSTIQ